MFFDFVVVPWDHFHWGLKTASSAALIAFIASVLCLIPIYKYAKSQEEVGRAFGALLVLAVFGGLVGYHGGNSRIGVVGDVLPAVLALVAGFAAYLFGVSEKKPGPYTFSLLGSFIITVFVTWGIGASNNGANNELNAYIDRCFSIYTKAIETPGGVEALDAKLGDYCDYAFDIDDQKPNI